MLKGDGLAEPLSARIYSEDESLHAPHLLDVEVAHALRRYAIVAGDRASAAGAAMEDLRRLRLRRYPHGPLLGRIWELRANLTAYDAAYVALAEALGAPLVTRDGRLARASGIRARIELFA